MNITIGIDEVGRGPIAGPVTLAALATSINKEQLTKNKKYKLRDSKKLNRKQRAEWNTIIHTLRKEGKIDFAISSVSAEVIDKIGISRAIQKALNACLKKLSAQRNSRILLDGGLKAPKEFTNQKTIIKGDEKEWIISLASIVAKESRDTYMRKMTLKYPQYLFENNVGYGTREHYIRIHKYGLCQIHRRSFLKKVLVDKHR